MTLRQASEFNPIIRESRKSWQKWQKLWKITAKTRHQIMGLHTIIRIKL